MNVRTELALPALGAPFEGGFFIGRILVAGAPRALIVPGTDGDHPPIAWNKSLKPVAGAMSFSDGRANTLAMAEAGSALAEWALSLRIGGRDDWYIPSRDELEMLYRVYKPTADRNWCWCGDNPSSIPVGYAYTPTEPAQTAVELFRKGGSAAFEAAAYWSSTQFAGLESFAWCQLFDGGVQSGVRKSDRLRARAVCRLPL